MSNPDEEAEKSHEPTQKKLDDAREKGEIAKSTDLTTAATYVGLLLAIFTIGPFTAAQTGEVLVTFLGQADTLSTLWFGATGGMSLTFGVIAALALPILGWFLFPAVGAILSIVIQRAFVFAPTKLQPKLSRISLISNAKNKFGRSGLFEFVKSAAKLSVFGFLLGLYLYWEMPKLLATAQFSPAIGLIVMAETAAGFFALVAFIAFIIGAIDYMWQYQEHIRKNRMSRKELTDETKLAEGDPQLKQKRRQRGYDIAMNKMLSEVPDADVVIVNPTHFAVALKWSRSKGSAPECVAKGADEIAHRIRETAIEAGVPIHRDPPTARALFASIEIGQEIHPEHYQAVAAAIRFAESIRKKARASV